MHKGHAQRTCTKDMHKEHTHKGHTHKGHAQRTRTKDMHKGHAQMTRPKDTHKGHALLNDLALVLYTLRLLDRGHVSVEHKYYSF